MKQEKSVVFNAARSAVVQQQLSKLLLLHIALAPVLMQQQCKVRLLHNIRKEVLMPTRNTLVLQRIVEVLGDTAPPDALARLEREFESSLLIIAGDVNDVARHAENLRLAITEPERAQVLDYIGCTHVAEITNDHVEDAINTLFEDRFIEP